MYRREFKPLVAGWVLGLVAFVGCKDPDATSPAYSAPTVGRPVMPHEAPADGATVLRIAAPITPGSGGRDRDVVFTTTAGQFQQAGAAPVQTIRVTAAANDTAIALLVAPTTPGLGIIQVSTATSAAQDTIRFLAATNGIASLEVVPPMIPADGATTAEVVAQLSPGAAGPARSVVFTTSLGTLVASGASGTTVTVAADASGRARAIIRGTDVGLALITASAGNGLSQDTLRFSRAFPDTILVESNPTTVKADLASSVSLTAYLRRITGLVTRGMSASFRATRDEGPAKGSEIGIFSVPTLSDATGAVTVRYSPMDTSYQGRILITAATVKAGGDTVRAQTTIAAVR